MKDVSRTVLVFSMVLVICASHVAAQPDAKSKNEGKFGVGDLTKSHLERLNGFGLSEGQVATIKGLVAESSKKMIEPKKMAILTDEQEVAAMAALLKAVDSLKAATRREDFDPIWRSVVEEAQITPEQEQGIREVNRLGAELWRQIRSVLSEEQQRKFDQKFSGLQMQPASKTATEHTQEPRDGGGGR